MIALAVQLTATELVSAALGLPIGVIGTHLWNRYRGRLAQLRWNAQVQPIAIASEDASWGTIQILYDGSPRNNIHSAAIQVQNASTRDLEKLHVILQLNAGTTMLRSGGHLSGSVLSLPITAEYSGIIQRYHTGPPLTPAERQQWDSRADYFVPVLNRGAVAAFSVIVAREDREAPVIWTHCDHPGVRLTRQDAAASTFGVSNGVAGLMGCLLTLGLVALAIVMGLPSWGVALITFTFAVFAIHTGALLVRAARLIGEVAS